MRPKGRKHKKVSWKHNKKKFLYNHALKCSQNKNVSIQHHIDVLHANHDTSWFFRFLTKNLKWQQTFVKMKIVNISSKFWEVDNYGHQFFRENGILIPKNQKRMTSMVASPQGANVPILLATFGPEQARTKPWIAKNLKCCLLELLVEVLSLLRGKSRATCRCLQHLYFKNL